MINPDWDRSKKNYDVVFRLLILAGVIMVAISRFLKVQPAKNITFGLAVALLFAGLIQFIMFKIRPRGFKDKSSNPGEKN